MTGVANFQSEFAKTALKIQARTSSYNMFTKSFSFSEAKGFLKSSKLAEKLAKKFGVASALFTLAEGASDGHLSTGDVTKAVIGLVATFGGPLGVLYTAVDLGFAIFSEDHKSLTDRIGDAIDKKLE